MDTSEPQDLHRPWLHQTVMIFRDSCNEGARRGRFQGIRSSSEGHDTPQFFLSSGRDVERSESLDRSLNLRFIGRRGGFVEELHDRGPIKPRSWRDRAAIVDLSSWKQSHDLGARFQPKMAEETSTIEA